MVNFMEIILNPDVFRSILTVREIQVLNTIINGNSNKDAGRLLGISPRTIEVHRFRIIEKLKVRNTPDMIRVAMVKHFGALMTQYAG